MQRPNLEFVLTMNGEPHTVKMTYGMFNEIMTVIPNPEDVGDLLISNPGLRDYVIRRLLTGNKRVLKEEDMVDPFDIDIDIGELDSMVSWVGDHVLYFFMKSGEKILALSQKYEETLTQLAQSKTGSEDLSSETPSAGASTAAKET